ncbi:MAG: ECF-type sigma factor [Steroidobacteraceae bacterium]
MPIDSGKFRPIHDERFADGRPPAVRLLADELVPLLYGELQNIAKRVRGRRSSGPTMQTTALVNETYLKLRDGRGWYDDAHFLCAAALAMRHILVNHAAARCAVKRGSGAAHLPMTAADQASDAQDEAVVNLHEALARLSTFSPRLAEVVECRYFGGYDERAIARALSISERTVRRDWTVARAWLHRELRQSADHGFLDEAPDIQAK